MRSREPSAPKSTRRDARRFSAKSSTSIKKRASTFSSTMRFRRTAQRENSTGSRAQTVLSDSTKSPIDAVAGQQHALSESGFEFQFPAAGLSKKRCEQ